MQTALEKHSFEATDEQQVEVFGESSEPVRQVRMLATSARVVLKNLK